MIRSTQLTVQTLQRSFSAQDIFSVVEEEEKVVLETKVSTLLPGFSSLYASRH